MASSLSTVHPDEAQNTRGPKEEQVYAHVSPSVVLVLTNDGFGSGSLISSDGVILTSYHVVRGYETVGVAFKPLSTTQSLSRPDIRTATVTKVDPRVDLALLKVTTVPNGSKPLELGNLSEIAVGSDVHAIGHPTGEMWTYTRGLVSQIRPAYEWQGGESDTKHQATVIQTQTPINPGNSGGPLISDQERLVGVNAFRSKGEGLNFAVAVDEVTKFLRSPGVDPSREPSGKTSPGCETRATKREGDQKLNGYVTQFDTDCDGKVDAFLLEPFEKRDPIQLWIDTAGDGSWRAVIFDDNRDGKWDRSFWDTKGDGHWHVVGIHENGTVEPTRWEPYPS